MKKPPVLVRLLSPDDSSCRTGCRPSFNGKEVPPSSETYFSLLVPSTLKDRHLEKLKKEASQMKNVKDAGRPVGTKKTQRTAAAAKELLEQGMHPRIVAKRINARFGTKLTAGAITKQVQRNYPTFKKS